MHAHPQSQHSISVSMYTASEQKFTVQVTVFLRQTHMVTGMYKEVWKQNKSNKASLSKQPFLK